MSLVKAFSFSDVDFSCNSVSTISRLMTLPLSHQRPSLWMTGRQSTGRQALQNFTRHIYTGYCQNIRKGCWMGNRMGRSFFPCVARLSTCIGYGARVTPLLDWRQLSSQSGSSLRKAI